MSPQESEAERLDRIRRQQIKARNPYTKDRRANAKIASRRKVIRQKQNFFKDSAKYVAKKWWGLLVGAVIALVIALILPFFLSGMIGMLAAVASFPIFMLIGLLIGTSLDWRDKMRDLIN